MVSAHRFAAMLSANTLNLAQHACQTAVFVPIAAMNSAGRLKTVSPALRTADHAKMNAAMACVVWKKPVNPVPWIAVLAAMNAEIASAAHLNHASAARSIVIRAPHSAATATVRLQRPVHPAPLIVVNQSEAKLIP